MKPEILITSVNAGGGHKTAMYSLGQTLEKYAPELTYEYFISGIEDLDRFHFFMNIYFPFLYELGYQLADLKIFRFFKNLATYKQNKKFQTELELLLAKHVPKIIISTHFTLTERLIEIKRKLNLDTKIVAYVPDYDTSMAHFPIFDGYAPDAMVAQNQSYLLKIQRSYPLPNDLFQEAGYITRPEFTKAREMTKESAKVELGKLFYPLANKLSSDRFTIVVTGGAGWVSKVYDEIQEFVYKAGIDWKKVQIVVICGTNKMAYNRFSHLARENYDKVIVPLPFLPYEHMALCFRSADLVLLASIAPATLYELVEVRSGPIIVHRFNPGQERKNLKFAIDSRLVNYIPEDGELIRYMTQVINHNSFPSKFELEFNNALEKERTLAIENAKATAEFIRKLARS